VIEASSTLGAVVEDATCVGLEIPSFGVNSNRYWSSGELGFEIILVICSDGNVSSGVHKTLVVVDSTGLIDTLVWIVALRDNAV